MTEIVSHLANNLPRRRFDAVIVGAGGAGHAQRGGGQGGGDEVSGVHRGLLWGMKEP